jgi:hypothetical protein
MLIQLQNTFVDSFEQTWTEIAVYMESCVDDDGGDFIFSRLPA